MQKKGGGGLQSDQKSLVRAVEAAAAFNCGSGAAHTVQISVNERNSAGVIFKVS